MSGTRPDAFAKLLEVIDRRAARFGPDRTGMWGYYHFSAELGTNAVLLDTGQLVPNPVIGQGVVAGSRYPCIWMQGGHDVLVIGLPVGCF